MSGGEVVDLLLLGALVLVLVQLGRSVAAWMRPGGVHDYSPFILIVLLCLIVITLSLRYADYANPFGVLRVLLFFVTIGWLLWASRRRT
jgi:hypothetical protein